MRTETKIRTRFIFFRYISCLWPIRCVFRGIIGIFSTPMLFLSMLGRLLISTCTLFIMPLSFSMLIGIDKINNKSISIASKSSKVTMSTSLIAFFGIIALYSLGYQNLEYGLSFEDDISDYHVMSNRLFVLNSVTFFLVIFIMLMNVISTRINFVNKVHFNSWQCAIYSFISVCKNIPSFLLFLTVLGVLKVCFNSAALGIYKVVTNYMVIELQTNIQLSYTAFYLSFTAVYAICMGISMRYFADYLLLKMNSKKF